MPTWSKPITWSKPWTYSKPPSETVKPPVHLNTPSPHGTWSTPFTWTKPWLCTDTTLCYSNTYGGTYSKPPSETVKPPVHLKTPSPHGTWSTPFTWTKPWLFTETKPRHSSTYGGTNKMQTKPWRIKTVYSNSYNSTTDFGTWPLSTWSKPITWSKPWRTAYSNPPSETVTPPLRTSRVDDKMPPRNYEKETSLSNVVVKPSFNRTVSPSRTVTPPFGRRGKPGKVSSKR